MARFLEYIPGTSFLHRMNPLAKLACALLISIACFCSTNIIFLACILVLDFALAATCKMTRQAAGLAKAVAIFSIILAIIALLTTPQGALLVALPWGYIGTGSLLAALIIIMRLIACAIPLFLVLYITKLGDIANACCKVLHVPYKYAFTFTSAVHFIPVFMNDMKGIMEAQTARGVEFDSGNIVKKLQLMVPLCVPLLVSSVRKINSAAIAAEVRGFNLRTPASGYKEYPFSGKDVLAMVLCLALIALALAINMLLALF